MNCINIHKVSWRVILGAIVMYLSVTMAGAQIVASSSLRGAEEERSAGEVLLLPVSRMPEFDVDSARVAMEQASSQLRTFFFAHKMPLTIDVVEQGKHSTMEDGTQVWRYRIRARGAKSLSFFFDRFELPQGGLLYIYDSFAPTNKIGGFGADNNNAQKSLPTMPIAAEDVVIELQAPKGTTPQLRLAEVNCGVRDLEMMRLSYPKYELGGPRSLECTPNIACHPSFADISRSVVMIAIDGVAMGTGTLVNNTRGDGKPLILTAAHVMSKNFVSKDIPRNASQTVIFFNYASPTCSGEIAPNTVQTLAGAQLVGYQEKSDAALIEMNQRPPLEYNAYYAGWNSGKNPQGVFVNIHHPLAFPKRINIYQNSKLDITSFPDRNLPFEMMQHYLIPSWTLGTTEKGSSGSPLLDAQNLVVGALSGGNSYCGRPAADFFYSLQKLWERNDEESLKIINALDPTGARATICQGTKSKEVKDEPIVRISNITMDSKGSIKEDLPQLSREALLGTQEGATLVGEYFKLRKDTKVHGLYLMVATTSRVVEQLTDESALEMTIYADEGSREIGQGVIPLKEAFPLIGRRGTSTEDKTIWSELYLEFPQPLFIPSDGGVIFGVKSSSIPKGITILHQQHEEKERGTLFWMRNNRWNQSPVSASLWVEPIISHPTIGDEGMKGATPLVTVENTPGVGVVISIPQPDEHYNHLDVYTLQGQRLYSADIRGGIHVLPRAPFEGLGIVVINIKVGKKQETIKAVFPKVIEQ